jgi:hypothetical protein
MRSLDGLRPLPDRIEVLHLAMVLGFFARPERLHRFHPLAHHAKPPGRIGAVVAHLWPVPSGTDAEHHASAGDVIQAGNLLGAVDGIPLRDEADCGAQQDVAGDRRRGSQRHERVQHAGVVARHAVGQRKLGGQRHVRVLGDPERFEAVMLYGPRQLRRPDAEIRGEHADAELHCRILLNA